MKQIVTMIILMTILSCKNKGSIQIMPEFSEQSSVLLSWNKNPYATSSNEYSNDSVSVQIVKNLITQGKIIIQCYDEKVKNRAINSLKLEGIDTKQIDFWVYPSDLLFPRDYGADIVQNEEGEKSLAGFNFDFYGTYPKGYEIEPIYKDFSKLHAYKLGITKSSLSTIISEGGDREFNGEGVMMAIEKTEVIKRNPGETKKEIEAEFKRQFGVQKILWLPQATYDDEHMYSGKIPDENGNFTAYRSASANGHIDEMCRFVDTNTILIAYISEEEAKKSILAKLNKERLDKAYEVLKNAADINGKAFKLIKMPVPDPIYINLKSGDPIFEDYISIAELYNHKLLDGTPFPKNEMKALPALSYCNFLIFNNVVLSQKYYKDGMPLAIKEKDQMAKEILEKVFPNRKVVAINTIALNLYGGGIHCNTKNVHK